MAPFSSPSGSVSPQSPARSLSSSFSVQTPATEPGLLFDEAFQSSLRESSLSRQYVLVTGGLGFIGSHTSLELLKAGYNVIIIDNLCNSFQTVLDRIQTLAYRHHEAEGTKCPSLELHAFDYRDSSALERLLDVYQTTTVLGDETVIESRIVGVIHFAAYKAVEESLRQPLKYYANNVSGLIDFTSILGDYNIKNFIFSSSATVYGTIADRGIPLQEEHCVHKVETIPGTSEIAEQGCTGITNPYGRTKWMCEAILADLAASDCEWKILALRYFNPIGCDSSGLLGEDPKGTPTNLLPVVVKVMTGQYARLSKFGDDWDTPDGTAVRDFIHVTDLARGHIAALASATGRSAMSQAPRFNTEVPMPKPSSNFRTYNLGTGNGNSVTDVVNTMQSVSGRPIPNVTAGRRSGDVGSCVARADRSNRELNWKTEKTLRDACADLCNFLRFREEEEQEATRAQQQSMTTAMVTAP